MMMSRDRRSGIASSANILIRHYQESIHQKRREDVEMGIFDDLPEVPIVKIEDMIGEAEHSDKDRLVEFEEDQVGTPQEQTPTVELREPSVKSESSIVRRIFSTVKELPPTFTLGCFVILVMAVVILAGVVASLYTRVGELLLTYRIILYILERLRRRFA